jgi:heme O synthase-like polyprenyltransferase
MAPLAGDASGQPAGLLGIMACAMYLFSVIFFWLPSHFFLAT